MPDNYRQDVFLKFHNIKQKELSVEEYTFQFDHLMLKGDLMKLEEKTIARCLGGFVAHEPKLGGILVISYIYTKIISIHVHIF